MSRLTLVCSLLVVLCAVLAVTQSKAVDKDAMAGKLISSLRAKMTEKKHKENMESETMKKRKDILTLKRKAFEEKLKKKSNIEVAAKNKIEGADLAESLTAGTDILSGLLNNGKKRGLKLSTKAKKGSEKKSYEEVFMVGEFILDVIDRFEMAPCAVGMEAFEDIYANIDFESIDWTTAHEDQFEPAALAFLEWWTENKCSEFFMAEYSFYYYVWSVFWDDLEETECYHELPQDADGTVDWTRAFDKVNSLDPEAWASYPEPQTDCELFEMFGELFFDFFLPSYFDVLPNNILEEIFNDYGVNDMIDPYFGYGYFYDYKRNNAQ